MSETEQPQEPEKTVFERDKTAKERQPAEDGPKAPIKPKPKIKKAFVAKKKTFATDKPMEHRVRNIRMTSMESAKMIWETLVDYQKELEQLEVDDLPAIRREKHAMESVPITSSHACLIGARGDRWSEPTDAWFVVDRHHTRPPCN